MIHPFLDYADFFRFRQVIGDQRVELPLPIFHMAAANHKDERLPTLLRQFGKVIVQIAAILEVDVKLNIGYRVPFSLGLPNVQREDRRAVTPVDR